MSISRHFQTHYTYEDYCQWEGHWELLVGTAVAMTPSPTESHERVITQLSFQIVDQIKKLGSDCRVYTNLDWKVSPHTVVRPDLMVVCGPRALRHLERNPQLAVEVLSPATTTADREFKFELYEQEGVNYYLIVDSKARSIQAFKLVERRYTQFDLSIEPVHLDESCAVRIEQSVLFD